MGSVPIVVQFQTTVVDARNLLSISICKQRTSQIRLNHATLLQLCKVVCLVRGSQYPGSWTRPMIMIIVFPSQAVVASTITRHPLNRSGVAVVVVVWWWWWGMWALCQRVDTMN
jgi:uncharacterized membrane protein YGL010W